MKVVVAGGGVAGCAAAVAAAEHGAEVHLVGPGAPGGAAVAAGHRSLCGLAPLDAGEPSLLEPDLVGVWVAALADGEPRRRGRVWLWPTTPERIRDGCTRRLAEAGVRAVDARVTGIETDRGRVVACRYRDDRLDCDAFVDASGGGDLAAELGCAVRPPALRGALRAVMRLPEAVAAACLEGSRRAALDLQRRAWDVAPEVSAVAWEPTVDGNWLVTCDVAADAGSSAVAAIARAWDAELRGEVRGPVERDRGGFTGELSLDSLFARRTRGLCWAAWPGEWHDRDGTAWRWPEAERHGVPAGCVHPAGAPENFRVVGLGLAACSDAVAALRVTGTALAIGAAVGTGLGDDR